MLALSVQPRVAFATKIKQSDPAQDAEQSLTADKVIEGEIQGSQVKRFAISLQPGEYARVRLMRHGIDLMLSIRAGNDGLPLLVESPAGPQSPLFASVMSELGGTYTLEVRPVRRWLALGRYEIGFERVTAPGEREQKRLLAQVKVNEGRRQQLLGTTDSLKAAITAYEQARVLWQELDDALEVANTLQFMAQTSRDMRNWESAKIYYEQALLARSGDPNARAYTLLDQADACYSLKGDADSSPLYDEALKSFITNNDQRGQALALAQIGLIQMHSYQWTKAEATLTTALNLNNSENDSYEKARVLNSLGGVSENLANTQQAISHYEEARKAFKQLGDKAREGNMYNNLAVRYDLWGEWRSALDNYNQAIKLLDDGLAAGDADRTFVDSKKASVFLNLGAFYLSLGMYAESLEQLNNSLALRPKREQGPTLMWIGWAHLLLNNPDQALQDCFQALAIQEPKNDPRRAQTYTVLGMVHDLLNKPEPALDYFNKALAIQQNTAAPDLQGQSITLDKRGAFFAAHGEMAKARADFGTALELWRRSKDASGEAMTLFNLAKVERDQNNIDVGLDHAQQAIKLIEPLRKNVAVQMRSSYFALKVDYYEVYIDLLMRSRGEENSEARTISAFEASERARARALLDSISLSTVESTIADPNLVSLIKQRQEYERKIVVLTGFRSRNILKPSPTFDLDKANRELGDLGRELDKVGNEIRTQYPAYASLTSADPLHAVDIQQQLDPDTQLLEFALGEKRSYAWVVTSEKIQGFELAPRKDIEALATRLLQAITERNRRIPNETPANTKVRWDKADKDYTDTAAALSKLVLTPIAPALQRDRLVVVADGALQLVPFGLLPDPAASSPLIAKHEIVSLPSASVLALQRQELANRKPAPRGVAVVADPVFEVNDQRVADAIAANKKRKNKTPPPPVATLPAKPQNETLISALRSVGADDKLYRLVMSRSEAADIERVVPKDQLFEALDFKASRAVVMSGALSKYRYVHLATHGVIDLEHPELSGVVFSMVDEKGKEQDGYVRLYEIYNLNLPAELVVLSACQTGVGKQIRGEGLMALTRGFMYAGAARVVASLWKVNDSATAALMAQFYKEMFTNGRKPAAALRVAQLYMSEQKAWKSPYYWAGFVLQGEWR